MPGLIGALRVDLSLDSAKFEAGTKRARSVAQRDATAIQKSLSGIKGSLNGLIAGATIGALAAATKRALDFAGGLGEVSQQLGVTTRDLQVYRYVASQVGVEQDTMDSSLAKLTRTMGQAADGSKAQVNAFRDLGVAIRDSNGVLYTAGEILPRLADAFARIKDPATRARIEAELFGRAGQKLDPLLTQGAKGIEALTKRAEELGLVLGDDLIKAADDASDKLAEMQRQLEVGLARAAANSANAIVGLANAFATLTSEAINFINKYPQLSGALAGAAAGARFGLPGAAIGGATGLVLGEKYAQARDNGNMDVKFRAKALKDSIAKWRGAKASAAPRATMSTMGMAGGISSGPGSDAAAWAEVERQWGLFNQAKASASASKQGALPPPGDLPTATGGDGKKSKDRSGERLERFNREMAGLADDQLQLMAEQTVNLDERAQIEAKRILTEREAYDDDVDSRVKQGELTEAQGEKLKLAKADIAAQEQAVMFNETEAKKLGEAAHLRDAIYDLQREELQNGLDEARTASERRRIALKLLDLQYEKEKAEIAQVEALYQIGQATDAELDAARDRLAKLDDLRAGDASRIRRSTMGPMESYLEGLPRSAEEIQEAFEGITVDALNNSLDVATRNIVKLKGVAGDLFNQLISDVIRFNLQTALTGGGSGILGSLGKLLGLAAGASPTNAESAAVSQVIAAGGFRLPGLANGGTFRAGGVAGIDRNVLAINGIPKVRVSANENVTVTPANANAPVARVLIEEAPSFASRVVGISGGVVVESARTNYRRGRQRL